jgi:hypothetical protein
VGTVSLKSEAASRSVRMLRTAMGRPAGRLWIDHLTGASATPGSYYRRKTASASCVSSPHHVGAEVRGIDTANAAGVPSY